MKNMPTSERKKLTKKIIKAYFEDCDTNMKATITLNDDGTTKIDYTHKPKPYTVSGLASALGITRSKLLKIPPEDEIYGEIQLALSKCEEFAESKLFETGAPTTGVSLALRNNFGWKEKTEVDSNQNVVTEIKVVPPNFGGDND